MTTPYYSESVTPENSNAVRQALREYFEAKHALETSDAHTRFRLAQQRVSVLVHRHAGYETDGDVERLIMTFGVRLFAEGQQHSDSNPPDNSSHPQPPTQGH